MTPAPNTTRPVTAENETTISGGTLDTSAVHARIDTFGRLFDAVSPPPESPALIYKQEGESGIGVFLLGEEELVVGRNPEVAGLAFPTSYKLSRAHFKIRRIEGFFVLTDLDSRNGIFINSGNERVSEHWMKAGDLILAGDLIFAFTGD